MVSCARLTVQLRVHRQLPRHTGVSRKVSRTFGRFQESRLLKNNVVIVLDLPVQAHLKQVWGTCVDARLLLQA